MMSKRSAEDYDLSADALANDPEFQQWAEAREQEWLREMDSFAADYDVNRHAAREFCDGLASDLFAPIR
jgi:hypothetical protein